MATTGAYAASDPRSALAGPKSAANAKATQHPARKLGYGAFWTEPPQTVASDGTKTWIIRGANAVVAISAVRNGTALSRTDQPDEYMLLTDYSVAATCRAGADRIEAGTASVTIIPPGDSEIVCRGEGYVVRCFTTRAEDIAGVALNRENYAEGAPECLLLQNWPDPVGGFKLRNYDLAAMSRVTFAHIIRATNLMLSTPLRGLTRRAPNALSPHHHDNFEQISIILEGRWIHHVRMPWTSDSTRWRNDEHLQYDAPSALVIPASVIHTSQDVGQGPCWLIDLFSPPREDFSRQPGWVLNAADYPAPWEVA